MSAMVRRDDNEQLSLFRSEESGCTSPAGESPAPVSAGAPGSRSTAQAEMGAAEAGDRKSTRLNSSHLGISYAVFCLKKNIHDNRQDAVADELQARARQEVAGVEIDLAAFHAQEDVAAAAHEQPRRGLWLALARVGDG